MLKEHYDKLQPALDLSSPFPVRILYVPSNQLNQHECNQLADDITSLLGTVFLCEVCPPSDPS